MLKSKSKAFKPKGPGRRPQPSREPTPSLKRKEREEDTTPQPPAKRVPTPTTGSPAPVEQRLSSPLREVVTEFPRKRYPTPEHSQTSVSEVLPQTTHAPATNPQSEVTQDLATNTRKNGTDSSVRQLETPGDIPSAADEQSLPSTTGASLGAAGGAIVSDSRIINQGSFVQPLGPAGDVGAGSANSQIARVSQVVPMAALNPDGTSGGIIEEPSTKGKKKKVVRKKKVQATQEGDDVRATIEMQLNRPRRAGKGKAARKKDKRKKQRAMTPEGAENETIDPATLTMSDLCKDLRIGKKFSKHQDIKDRIMAKKLAADAEKARKKHPEMVSLLEGEAANVEGAAAPNTEVPADDTAQGESLQLRIVNNQIVIDERSIQIDRHKQGQTEQGVVEMVEENDFTHITTSGSHMKRERAQVWDHAAMQLFYKGLQMFGTDFTMIANMFPHRNRRQIKLKYNKEERENPTRLTRALTGPRLNVDWSEYEKLTKLTFQEVHEIDAEAQVIEKEHGAEQAKHAAETAEATRKKKEAIREKGSENGNTAKRFLASLDDDDDARGGGESAKENREPSVGNASGRSKSREPSAAAPGRGKKKAAATAEKIKKNKHSHRAGGEEVEVFGDVV